MEAATQDGKLILSTKREALIEKLNSFKNDGLTSLEQERYQILIDRTTRIFIQLCWRKLGISLGQLRTLSQEDLDELASLLYERSKAPAIFQTFFWLIIPLVGQVRLLLIRNPEGMQRFNYGKQTLALNLNYFWWIKRLNKKLGKKFSPKLDIPEDI